ncbi:hypothetical protein [Flavobacterium cerinum]|uniref:Uncharacterized protein n=1 Tax=Flavobacterium cerinum TaxID=2502784 RepID=A0ABY5ISN0_9FLAO|nr:hypothetical protein [Flavobacterium cerinum]UUC44466.1 hypothetical protein NOX80_12590 [Flavobacterium cerinum]
MIQQVLDFVGYIKAKPGFYTVEDNLEEALNFSERAFNFLAAETKKDFLYVWDREVTDEDLKWEWIGNLKLDWELTIENIYLYGGFKNWGFCDALAFPPQSDYSSIACQHDFFTEEEERFLEEETNLFCKSAHGMGDGTYGIFHRTKEKYPFDILYLDNGRFFKTNFSLDSYYQAMIDSMAVCGWQYFYLDFEEIKTKCADFKVGYWLLYPYTEGLIESPLGRNVTRETSRLDALLHHMEVCVYLLPKIFPDKDFSYHKQRLDDFKTFLNQ